VFRVAERYGLTVTLVANTTMHVPYLTWIKLVVVNDHLDAADDWIVEHVEKYDIVISADIPLASRCIKKGALVLGSTGNEFTEDNVSQALATRDLLAELRMAGTITGGPAQFQKQDRSRFLQSLDRMIQGVKREMSDC
jgi:uncharacterized protein YaiI (UPF0178 family)